MKNKLTEHKLHKIIKESVKNVLLKENMYELRQPYQDFMAALDSFQDALYDYESTECTDLADYLSEVESKCYDVFSHPDVGGGKTIWDSIGY